MDVTYDIDARDFFAQLDAYESRLTAGEPIVLDGVLQMGDIYLDFTRKRFLDFSEGGGDWKPDAESTVKRKGHNRINRDTDALLKSLTPNAPGNVRKVEKPGKVVVGSSVPHVRYVQADRPVFVEPDARTRARMDDALALAVSRFVADVFAQIK